MQCMLSTISMYDQFFSRKAISDQGHPPNITAVITFIYRSYSNETACLVLNF
jgi:hypothetical protein